MLHAAPIAAFDAHGEPGLLRDGLADKVTVLAEERIDLTLAGPKVGNGRAFLHIEGDLLIQFKDLDLRSWLRREKIPPIAGHRRQTAPGPKARYRLEIIRPQCTPVATEFTLTQAAVDEAKGRIDAKIKVRGPLRLGIPIGKTGWLDHLLNPCGTALETFWKKCMRRNFLNVSFTQPLGKRNLFHKPDLKSESNLPKSGDLIPLNDVHQQKAIPLPARG